MDYVQRYEGYLSNKLFNSLDDVQQDEIKSICFAYYCTMQEFRELVEYSCDLNMWNEVSLRQLWDTLEIKIPEHIVGSQRRKKLFKLLRTKLDLLRSQPTDYSDKINIVQRKKLKTVACDTQRKIFGECPVQSPKTVCCNLKTIDAVENCLYGCSYCTIQTFYGNEVRFDVDLKQKLSQIKIDINKYYHFGTGQSSDSLAWGNKKNNLQILCDWARQYPNVMLEFKTKSDNISWLLDNDVPANVVCSWSLNPQTIIDSEEHFTASLSQRLNAAKQVAQKGIKVAFHFHPMIYYKNWQEDYTNLANTVMEMFDSQQVQFISFGTVTLIKPVMQAIRQRGEATKILQMQPTPDPHGKLSYPDHIKIKLFKHIDLAFENWRGKVFRYLCMEHKRFWDEVFGWHYANNDEFEQDFAKQTLGKLKIK